MNDFIGAVKKNAELLQLNFERISLWIGNAKEFSANLLIQGETIIIIIQHLGLMNLFS